MITKSELLAGLLEVVRSDIANGLRLLEATQTLVKDAPGAMQSHSDTSKFQGGILVNRQGEILQQKQEHLRLLSSFISTQGGTVFQKIEVGCAFTIDGDDGPNHFLLLPCFGGQEVVCNNRRYCVITIKSPISGQLIGKKVGERVRLTAGGRREVHVIEII